MTAMKLGSFLIVLVVFCAVASQTSVSGYIPTKSLMNVKSIHQLQMTKSSNAETFVDAMSAVASEALGRQVEFESASGGGYGGGGGASTSAVVDKQTGTKYFVKSARGGLDMLRAEYEGVKAMSDTNTIQVPTPIAFGEYGRTNQGFAKERGRREVVQKNISLCVQTCDHSG